MNTKNRSSRRTESQPFDATDSFRLYTKGELAKRCQVSTRSIDNWMREGKVPFLKIGRSVRFSPKRVEEFLQQFNQEAADPDEKASS